MSRIQRKNREAILSAALDMFSQHGFKGATLDQIAAQAGLSKPNLLYYFPSKEEIHRALLNSLLDQWLLPLNSISAKGEPLQEILSYMRRKLELVRIAPRESRIFASLILLGAPHSHPALEEEVRRLVLEKAIVLRDWMDRGLIARCDPVHLIFAIWTLTQQYAECGLPFRVVLGEHYDPHQEAEVFLEQVLRRMLRPRPQW
ncbi:TetR family transcriptional regulator C-terminal domain-containing protein [Pseudogemmobacter faecipullorum]|uniref:TetR family transcriptional regulator C-terminal domain-containing protein n=1 Tax=Pseudogemmobacter faecipullorum TaxID=2755041 RepID=A0ABS8CK32_9RHOB|nr:TetR family transcriptional regulator C-terminal domain-containing protein [Pseudogemmobacter faecipullorum]MCB5409735.1 TetR family transcriptional regulator C-terminal domain-containing protein [Pseudogemmobacter faecipullorum]